MAKLADYLIVLPIIWFIYKLILTVLANVCWSIWIYEEDK